MSDERKLTGQRDVRVSVETPTADIAVVACPPHPQLGGSRTDPRLKAVGETLGERAIACYRFDYGPWDEGVGEKRDAGTVLAHARDRHDTVGLFGYSFGAGVAVLAAADAESQPAALSVLAPPAAAGEAGGTVAAFDAIERPIQVIYGERDDTVDRQPLVDRARDRDTTVDSYPADHFFVGQVDEIAELVGAFFAERL